MGRRLFLIYVAGLTGFVVYAVFGLRPGPSEADHRKLDEDIAAFRAQRWERAPELGGGVEGDAFEHYERALSTRAGSAAEFGRWNREMQRLIVAFPGGAEVPAGLREALRSSPVFAELIAGARCARVGPAPGLFERSGGGSTLPNDLIQLGRIVTASAGVLAAEGRPARAVDRLLALHGLGQDVASGGNLLCLLLGTVTMDRAALRLGDLVGSGSLPPAEVERVRDFARRRREWAVPWEGIFRAETIGVRALLLEETWPGREAIPLVDLVGAELGIGGSLPPAALTSFHRLWPVAARLAEEHRDEADPFGAVRRRVAGLPASAPLSQIAGRWPGFLPIAARYRTRVDGLLLGIDLWEQRERAGSLPAKLPAGWTLTPIPGKKELGLYPPGAGPDGWVFRMPAGR